MLGRLMATAAAGAALSLCAAAPASADIADPHASCAGLALSDHAVEDGPGAIAGLVAEVKGAAEAFGFANGGQVVSRFARVHAGTHEPGCEDAFVAVLTEGP